MMAFRPVTARATRSAAYVASDPLFVRSTRSAEGTWRADALGEPDLEVGDARADDVDAVDGLMDGGVHPGSAWPRMMGPNAAW